MAKTTKSNSKKKPLTKREQLIQLLGNAEGVTVHEVSEALDWLPHTVRAALTRVRAGDRKLKKLPPAEGERCTRYRLEKAWVLSVKYKLVSASGREGRFRQREAAAIQQARRRVGI